jgi:hypothetical protein
VEGLCVERHGHQQTTGSAMEGPMRELPLNLTIAGPPPMPPPLSSALSLATPFTLATIIASSPVPTGRRPAMDGNGARGWDGAAVGAAICLGAI